MAALALAPPLPRPAGALPAKLPEVAPPGVTKEGAWAYALNLFSKTKKLEKANDESEKMADLAVEGLAGAGAAVAVSFMVPLALEFFPKIKKIGPAGGFQVDTEFLLALAALGIGFGCYMLDVDGGLIVYASGIALTGSYVGSKGREWGASWAAKKGSSGGFFSMAA